MRKNRLRALGLAAALLLLAAACAAPVGGLEATRATEPATTSKAPIIMDTIVEPATQPPTQPPLETQTQPPDITLDMSDCQPWQRAYMGFLTDLCAREAVVRQSGDEDAIYNLSQSYSLYDVDEDGIPELFIKFGVCEADYNTVAHTLRDGAVTPIGEFYSGHSSLASWPVENAVLYDWGHMGGHYVQKGAITDGQLVFSDDLLLSEDLNALGGGDYTPIADIVPGAVTLDEYWTTDFRDGDVPLILPIIEYGQPPREPVDAPYDPAVRAAIAQALAGEREIYGLSADGFGVHCGPVSFSDYCRPGVALGYGNQPWTPRQLAWLDMNRDGQQDCVVQLTADDSDTPAYMIFSLEAGVVYAYFLQPYGYELGMDGVFYSTYDTLYPTAYSLSFSKNQSYTYPCGHRPDAPGLSWEPTQG